MQATARIETLELAETFVIARGAQRRPRTRQVEIRHDGVSGFGEAAPIERYDESAASALACLEEHAGALGDDPLALEEIMARLPPGELAARAAVDARCTTSRASCRHARLAAARPAPRGPPTSWTIWLGDPDDMARRAERPRRAASGG